MLRSYSRPASSPASCCQPSRRRNRERWSARIRCVPESVRASGSALLSIKHLRSQFEVLNICDGLSSGHGFVASLLYARDFGMNLAYIFKLVLMSEYCESDKAPIFGFVTARDTPTPSRLQCIAQRSCSLRPVCEGQTLSENSSKRHKFITSSPDSIRGTSPLRPKRL